MSMTWQEFLENFSLMVIKIIILYIFVPPFFWETAKDNAVESENVYWFAGHCLPNVLFIAS